MQKKTVIQISLNIFGAILYKLVLDATLVILIAPNFGLFRLNISNLKIFESYVILILFSCLIGLPYRKYFKPSCIVIFILYLVTLVPILTLYGFQDGPRDFVYMSSLSILIIIIIVGFLPSLKLLHLQKGAFIASCIAVFISLYVYGQLIIGGGLGRLNFNLYDVYIVRNDYLSSMGPFMGYLVPWQAYVINMLSLSYTIYFKKTVLAFLVVFFQVLIFGMTGFKSFLFAPILVIVLVFYLKNGNQKKIFFFMTISSTFILVFSNFIYFVYGDIMTPSIFARRLFYIPAKLHIIYYDFFLENPKIMLSNSILSAFIEYPYNNKIVNLISLTFLGTDGNANVGFIGESFAHFGFIGIMLFSSILGIVLKLLDDVLKRLPIALSGTVIAIPAFALTNSGLFTVMLTHGFLVAILFLWLIGNKNYLPERFIKI